MPLTVDQLADRLSAVANPHRLRVLAELARQPTHVSGLARRLGMSRALLYVHLRRLASPASPLASDSDRESE